MTEPKLQFELLLVRHGQSDGNTGVGKTDTVRDRQDPDLSVCGCRQAKLLAERFSAYPLDALFSSGLLRAVHTASEVAAVQPQDGAHAVEVLPLLTEQFPSMEVLNYYALRAAKDVLKLQPGDTVVMTGGNTSGESGNTNVIRIETVR